MFRGNFENEQHITKIGGTMKKVLLTSLLVLVMIFAFALTNENIMSVTRAPFDANPMAVKDSMAIAAGAVSILNLGGDMRGFAPTPLTSMTYDPANDLLQVITGQFNSGGGTFDGVYNTYSTDNGATWSTPALISDAGAWVRNYNSIVAAPADNYPYVVVCNRTASMIGDWFTTDALGPGGGGWTANMLITDTVNGAAYMPTLAVNNDGSKVAFLAYDAALGFGINNSTDYGSSWGTYSVPSVFDPYDLASGVWWVDVSKLVWASGDNVYAVLGMVHNDDTIRSDIAGSGPGSAIGHGLSVSTDGGATYSAVAMAFGSNSMPNFPSMNGDTFEVYVDETDNATADTVVYHAYLDPTTGLWDDDMDGSIGGGNGFGSWWYWWDVEIIGDIVYAALPYADLFVDYYADADGDFYTFPWQGQSIMFGKMDLGASETSFTWIRKDIHDDNILSPAGDTPTWLGNAYSANVAGLPNGDCYVVFNDYYDTATGETSIMYMYYDESANTLSDPMVGVLNTGAYEMETAAMAEVLTDSTARIHCGFVSGSQDSIYYITFDADYAKDGIEDVNTAPAAAFNVPSLVRDNGELSFTLSTSGRVEIALYDVTGREIRSLANSTFTKGSHTVNFSADDLSTGIYFAKIKSDDLNASKKVIVVR